ncbi:ABC transporter substrate-binding protein [Streptosporangium sp. NPDC004631]
MSWTNRSFQTSRGASPRRFAELTSVVAAVALLAACGGAGTGATDGGAAGKEIVEASQTGVTSFDPLTATPTEVHYLRPVYDTLVQQVTSDKYGPGLATEWKITDGGRTVVFTLREGVTFSDGTPFNADAVVAHFKRGMTTETSPYAPIFGKIATVEASDAKTVTLTLKEVFPPFIDRMAYSPGMIASPKADPQKLRLQPVGTGPWVLDPETQPNTAYVYTKSAKYWDPSVQKTSKITIKPMSEPAARSNALLSGQVVAAQVAEPDIAGLEKKGLKVVQTDRVTLIFSVMDREGEVVPALKDPRVREALSISLDRKAIIDTIYYGKGQPMATYPEDRLGHNAATTEANAYDPARAKKLLAEAGFPDGFSFELPSFGANLQLATALVGQWAKVGVKANIKEVDLAAYRPLLNDRKVPVAVFGYANNVAYQFYLDFASPTGMNNPFRVKSPEADATAHQIAALADPAGAEAKELYAKLTDGVAKAGTYIVGIKYIQQGAPKGLEGNFDCDCSILPEPRGMILK